MRSAALPSRRTALPWALAGLLLVLALALAAPLIAPQDPADPLGFDPLAANHPPSLSWTYLLGADARGRSVLALLLWGSRVSLAIGIGAAVLAAALGLLLGLLSCWRGGLLDALLSRLMEGCQAVPPLLPALLLAGHLGSVPWPLLLAVFALTGWVAPARLTRASAGAAWRAAYVEAARALGAGGPRLLAVHVLPAVAPALAAWMASGAATYVALEAGLDFLGLGLPAGTISWGTALAGAQDALPAGNWWWMACGGLALAAATLALGALARGLAAVLQPGAIHRGAGPSVLDQAEAAPTAPLGEVWAAWTPRPASGLGWRGGRAAAVAGIVVGLAGLGLGAAQALHAAARPVPDAAMLLARATTYTRRLGLSAAYIAVGDYAATEAMVTGHHLPWSAWGACPSGMPGRRCARSEALFWYRDGQERVQTEGSIAICAPGRSWVYNPMAGVAQEARRGCAALGPGFGQLGITAGAIAALLPTLHAAHPRVAGADAVAGRHCWIVALSPDASICLDAASGLALRVQRLNRLGQPVAGFTLTGLSFGVDVAPQLFANPIPGGHGPFVSSLTQPLLDLQAADDLSLFTTLVPAVVPAGLGAQTPTFDSFYDATRGYAPQQRVRQAYVDGRGRVSLVLIETSPHSAWDVTPASGHAERVTIAGQSLQAWPATRGAAAVVRRTGDDTAALLSSRVLPLAVLERIAAGLR